MSTINLLPEDYARRRGSRRANVLCVALFACVMAAVVGAQAVWEINLRNARSVLAKVDADYEAAARLIEQMRQMQAQEERMRRRAEVTASLIERVPRSTLLAILATALPEHGSLLSVDIEVQRVATRTASPTNTAARARPASAGDSRGGAVATMHLVMAVKGLAATDVEVARLISDLGRSPLVQAVDLVYSQEREVEGAATMREFELKVELVRDADAIDLQPVSARSETHQARQPT